MTLVSVRPETGRVTFPRFSNLLETFFENEFPATPHFDSLKTPALVNTIETKDSFKIEVAAPGFEKDQIKVAVEENTLKIWAEKESE
jgi:HSP20 family protein